MKTSFDDIPGSVFENHILPRIPLRKLRKIRLVNRRFNWHTLECHRALVKEFGAIMYVTPDKKLHFKCIRAYAVVAKGKHGAFGLGENGDYSIEHIIRIIDKFCPNANEVELVPSYALLADKAGRPIIPATPHETFEAAASLIPILRQHLPKFNSLNIQLPLAGCVDLQRLIVEHMSTWTFLRELHLISVKEFGPNWPRLHEKCVRLIKVKEEMENLVYNHPKFESLCREKCNLEAELAEELMEYDEEVKSDQFKFYFAEQLAEILRGLPPDLKVLSLENDFVTGFVLNSVAAICVNMSTLKIGGLEIKFDPPTANFSDFIPLLDRLHEFSVGEGFPWADRL